MLHSPQILLAPRKAAAAGGGGGSSAAYTNFLARTTALNTTHQNAYGNFLDGLTTDGLFNSDGTTNFFDCLYIFATQDQTTALLNLVSSSFAILNSGSIPFTADSGFNGDNAHALNSQFNAATATSPKFTQDSAHFSAWNLTNATDSNSIIAGGTGSNLYPKFSDNNAYGRVNETPESGGFAITDPRGHLLANRSSSTGRQLYQNASTTLNGGTSASYGSVSSQAVNSQDILFLNTGAHTIAAGSIGASLNATQVTNFYNRLRAYMTAVGVP